MPPALPPLLHLGAEVALLFQMPPQDLGVLPVASSGKHPHCELVHNEHSPLFYRVSAVSRMSSSALAGPMSIAQQTQKSSLHLQDLRLP